MNLASALLLEVDVPVCKSWLLLSFALQLQDKHANARNERNLSHDPSPYKSQIESSNLADRRGTLTAARSRSRPSTSSSRTRRAQSCLASTGSSSSTLHSRRARKATRTRALALLLIVLIQYVSKLLRRVATRELAISTCSAICSDARTEIALLTADVAKEIAVVLLLDGWSHNAVERVVHAVAGVHVWSWRQWGWHCTEAGVWRWAGLR